MRMHPARWIALTSVAFLLSIAAPLAQAQGGPFKLETAQLGIMTTELQIDTPFEVMGAGFHARVLPVKVCVDGRGCQLALVEKDGSFVVSRSFLAPGVYQVQAWQARNTKLTDWVEKASLQVAVHN